MKLFRLFSTTIAILIAAASLPACTLSTPVTLRETVTVKETVPVKETVAVKETVQVIVTATPPPTPTPKRGGTLIAARTDDVRGLDPHRQADPGSLRVLELIYEPLFTFDKEMRVAPNLAAAWQWSDDGKRLTVTLAPNIRFHNGDALTAADVKFSFERLLDEKTNAVARATFTDIDRIDTPDAATVVFVLKKPNVPLLAAMAQPTAAILSRKFVTGGNEPSKITNGTGAFKLAKWEQGRALTLTANRDYWIAGLPRLEGIEFRVAPDETTLLAGLRAKTFDWAIIADPRVAIRAGAGNSTLTIARAPALGYRALTLNSNRPLLSDARVRQAIACALDRQELIDVVALGEGQATSPVTLLPYRAPVDDLFCAKKDLDKVKQLLTDAKTGAVKFKILASNDETQTTLAEAQNIQSQLKKAGIDVDVESVDQNTLLDRWSAGNFDAAVVAFGGYPDPDVMLARFWQSSGGANKIAGYKDAELDRLFEQGRATMDPDKRKTIYNAIQKKLTDAAPWVWLYAGYEYRVMQSYVYGFAPLQTGTSLSLREIWMDK